MKTLDEVIRANKCCDNGGLDSRCEDCPYSGIGACLLERKTEALHYLEEYKNKQNVGTMMLALHNINKTVCDDCWLSKEMVGEGFKQIYKKYIEEENPPLTWDELKQMFHKPVWIETKTKKGWVIINNFEAVTPNSENMNVIHTSHRGAKCSHFARHLMGQTWQAFRKERHEDVD